MAVDRGGLRYPIIVENQFSAGISAFRTEIGLAKKDLAAFKKEAQKGTTKAAGSFQETEVKQAEKLRKNELRNIRNFDNELTRIRDRQQALRERVQKTREDKEIRLNKILKDREIKAVQSQAATPRTGGPALANLGNFGQLSKIQSLLSSSQAVADRASFSFQRLFTVLTAFAAARFIVGGFGEIVSRMISFNSTIEKAQLGLASLFLAVGSVKDATGNTTTAAQGLALAQGEARKQTALLRKDALQTAATFEELLQTFQVAVGPGLQAGLGIDDIRKFTVQVSQAAAAIGLPQNQLAEEIRSILSGTINVRNTRIAAALGITNQDIKNAKEQGNLIGFLQQKFSAFTIAGQESLGTFSVLLTQVEEGLTTIIGAGGLNFFNDLKNLLKDVFSLTIQQDPLTGLLTPNPQAVAAVRQIADGLSFALAEAKKLGSELGFQSLLGVATLIGGAIKTAALVISGIVTGFTKGLSDLVNIATLVVGVIKQATGVDLFNLGNIKEVVSVVTRILTVFLGIVAAGKLFVIALAPVAILVNGIIGAFSILLGTARLIAGVLTSVLKTVVSLFTLGTLKVALFAAGFVAVVVVLQKVLSAITGIDLKFSTLLQLLPVISKSFARVANGIEAVFTGAYAGLKNGLLIVIDFIQTNVDGIVSTLQQTLAKIPGFSQKTADAFDAISAKDKKNRLNEIETFRKEMEDQFKKFAGTEAELEKETNNLIDKALKDNATNPTIAEGASAIADKIKEEITSAVSEIGAGLFPDDLFGGLQPEATDPAAQGVEKISDVLSNLPGIVNASRDSIKGQSEAVRELGLELDKTNAALAEGTATLGVTGVALQLRQEAFQTEQKIKEATKKLDAEAISANENLKNIQLERERSSRRFNALTDEQKRLIEGEEIIARDILKSQSEIALLEQTINQEKAKEQLAIQQGNEEQKAVSAAKIKADEKSLETAQKILELQKKSADTLVQNAEPATVKLVTEQVKERIGLQGQEKAAAEQVTAIQKDRIEVENLLNQQAISRITLLAKQSSFELASQNKLAAQENLNARNKFAGRFDLKENQAVVAAQGELDLLRLQVLQAQAVRDAKLQSLQVTLQQIKASRTLLETELAGVSESADPKERLRLENGITAAAAAQVEQEKFIGLAIEENNLLRDAENLKLEQASFELQHAKDILNAPLSTGILDGLREAALEIPSLYEGVISTIKGMVSGFTDFAASAIVDAFDPTKDVNLKERFARFLQDIAKQVLQMFIQLAIQKALLGLTSIFGGGAGGVAGGGGSPLGLLGGLFGGGGGGFHEGGKVPHRHARGFAAGGPIDSIRPAGLHPKDTVPIWAQPGEWVMPVKQAMMYGADVMEALRRGLVDPTSLRALAGVGAQRRRVRSSSGPGFAGGGFIEGRSNNSLSRTRRNASTQASSAPGQSFVVANDQNIERLLAGGKNAFFRFIQDNKAKLGGMLRTT